MEEKLRAIENFIANLMSKYGEEAKNTVMDFAMYKRNYSIVISCFFLFMTLLSALAYLFFRKHYETDIGEFLTFFSAAACFILGIFFVIYSCLYTIPFCLNPLFATFEELVK